MQTEHPNKGRRWGRPFKPGETGNKGGRSKKWHDAAHFAREHSIEAMQVLLRIMRDKRVTPATRVNCASALLDRGLGKPLMTAIKATVDLRDANMLTDAELAAIALGQQLEPAETTLIDTVDVTPNSSSNGSS